MVQVAVLGADRVGVYYSIQTESDFFLPNLDQ